MSIPMETITDETELRARRLPLARRCRRRARALLRAARTRGVRQRLLDARRAASAPSPQARSTSRASIRTRPRTSTRTAAASSQRSAGDWTLAACWQVHGTDVRVVRGEPTTRARSDEHCDALTTNLRGVLLGVKTADCVPVVLGDARTGACAAVHAGWRGTLAGIVTRALARMREEFGTEPSDVRAAVGPAALGCCYEVGARSHRSLPRKVRVRRRALHADARRARARRSARERTGDQLVARASRPSASTCSRSAPCAAQTSSSPTAATGNSTAARGACSPSSASVGTGDGESGRVGDGESERRGVSSRVVNMLPISPSPRLSSLAPAAAEDGR